MVFIPLFHAYCNCSVLYRFYQISTPFANSFQILVEFTHVLVTLCILSASSDSRLVPALFAEYDKLDHLSIKQPNGGAPLMLCGEKRSKVWKIWAFFVYKSTIPFLEKPAAFIDSGASVDGSYAVDITAAIHSGNPEVKDTIIASGIATSEGRYKAALNKNIKKEFVHTERERTRYCIQSVISFPCPSVTAALSTSLSVYPLCTANK